MATVICERVMRCLQRTPRFLMPANTLSIGYGASHALLSLQCPCHLDCIVNDMVCKKTFTLSLLIEK